MQFNDETDWINELIKGSDAAFTQLIRQYHSTMLYLARSIVGDVFAEDVVQEAWVSVYTNIANFERRSSLKTWLFRIVSNLATTKLRKESRKTSLEQLDGEIPGSYLDESRFQDNCHWKSDIAKWRIESPDELLEEQQLKHCIHKTLAKLPDLQKTVFLLREIEQIAFEEICEILNISSANVRVLLHRARLQLMQMIDHYQETGSC
jgi:RNA polymerase sigma-70 factor (ECF subfamily)